MLSILEKLSIPRMLAVATFASTLTLSATAQDLAAISLSSSRKTVTPGQEITVSSTIKNVGLLKATGKSVQSAYYLSDSIVLIPQLATLLGTFKTPALGVGKQAKHSMTVTIPKSITSKTYYLFVRADHNGKLIDLNRLNNDRWMTLNGSATDLTASLTAPGPLTAGSTIEVVVTVRNAGSLVSGPTTALLFLSSDPFIKMTDVFIGAVDVPKIPGNTGVKIKRSVVVPHCRRFYTLLGQTSLGVIVNPPVANRIPESSYANNDSLLLRAVNLSHTKGRVLEWRATYREDGLGPLTLSRATFRLPTDSAKGDLCVTAPNDKLSTYVLVWSASPQAFVADGFTFFALANINSILFPGWMGTVGPDGSQDKISFNLPRIPGIYGLRLYTYHYYLTPNNAGFGNNAVESNFVK